MMSNVKKYERGTGFLISRMKTKLDVLIRRHCSDYRHLEAITRSIALLSHVSVHLLWLWCSTHSSVVQHLLICNNNFIWAREYVMTEPPTTRKKQNTYRERRDTFHLSPLAIWHKGQHCCGVFVTSEVLAGCWMQWSGCLYSQCETCSWGHLTYTTWWHKILDSTLKTDRQSFFHNFSKQDKLGATLNLLGLMQ